MPRFFTETSFFLFLDGMKHKKYWVLIFILFAIAISIRLFSMDAFRVETHYSTGLYPLISLFMRYVFGWLPFSAGDILYGAVILWLIAGIFKVGRLVRKRKQFSGSIVPAILRTTVVFLAVYIVFNVLWGMNYNRRGISSQLGLIMEQYSVAELKNLNELLLQKTNTANALLRMQAAPAEMSRKELFHRSQEAYFELNKQYAFINYKPASLKRSMWGWLGNYVGFLGYYNPFTGEGQVNTTVPKFLQPYTCCHEIAHQLGYAKENEANFVGYLAAASSKDVSFQYSVYLDLFLYANRNLYQTDSSAARGFANELLPAVKEDLKEWRKFDRNHKNPVEPLIRWAYGKYLESNEQPSGLLSYDEVTGFLIAYQKKFGKI